MTRAMLYEEAIAILTRIPKNFKLRLWGLRLLKKKGLKKAATAVARALAAPAQDLGRWFDLPVCVGLKAAESRAHERRKDPACPSDGSPGSATAERRLPGRRGHGRDRNLTCRQPFGETARRLLA